MKSELRKKYLYIRNNISNRELKDKIIFDKVINNNYVNECDVILIYVSYNNEVDTINIINYFLGNKKIAVPRIDNDIMSFYYINSINDLKKGYYGIMESISNDKVINYDNAICITPGICFDKRGYRVGYGKGFYDKFFSKHHIYSIGLCYKECFIEMIDNDIHDIAVNCVITD